MINRTSPLTRFLVLILAFLLPTTGVSGTALTLPAGTSVYGELDERVTSKKKETAVGDIVRARVWRDVVVEGRVVIRAGSPLVARVSFVKPAKIAGRKGEVFIEAVSARAVDDSEVLLDGGYDKSGKGYKAVAWSLFALVAWPLVFIKGKQAILDPGTVFDASVQADSPVKSEAGAPFALKLGSDEPDFEAEILYDEIEDEKQKTLPMLLKGCGAVPGAASVVSVNEQDIPAIPITLAAPAGSDDCFEIRATLDVQKLAKHFKRGINRFVIEAGDLSTEVLLEIEL